MQVAHAVPIATLNFSRVLFSLYQDSSHSNEPTCSQYDLLGVVNL